MFISRETFEKLIEAYNNCLSISLVPSEYIELADVVCDFISEIQEYDESDGEPDLEHQELEDYCQDVYFENMECGDDGYWYG